MKIDFDRKHPLSSVNLIPEGKEDEYLTEEETAEFRKVAMRCVRLSYATMFFAIFAFLCEFFDGVDLLGASSLEKTLAIIGYVGLGFLFVCIGFLFHEGRKLTALSKKYAQKHENDGSKEKNDGV